MIFIIFRIFLIHFPSLTAQFGALDVMELLIENGADVDSRDNIDHTPIIISSYYTKSDVSAALVEKGNYSNRASHQNHSYQSNHGYYMVIIATMATMVTALVENGTDSPSF